MELVNATRKTIDSGAGPADPAVREAAEAMAMILDLFAPHTAEEMWEALGYEPFVGLVPWRTADPTLLVEDSVTAVVQIDGKVRATIDVPARVDAAELERIARADERVVRALAGREISASRRPPPEGRELHHRLRLLPRRVRTRGRVRRCSAHRTRPPSVGA